MAEDTVITSDCAPVLRPDVFLTPSGSGTVHVHSSRGTDLIAAPGIAGWLERLTPFLDGTRTVDDLLGGLDGDRRTTVLGILQLLDRHGLLADRAAPGPDRQAASYSRLRVLVLAAPGLGAQAAARAPGPGMPGAAGAAATAGAPADPVADAPTCALANALRLTGLPGLTPVSDHAAARAAVAAGGHDALLLLAPGDDPRAVARLDEDCRAHGLWFAAAVRDAESWWLGPTLCPGPERPAGGWLGAWLRVHGTHGAPEVPRGPGEAAEFAATLLVHRFQQAFTGSPAAAAGAPEPLVRLDARTLTTTRHHYRPHPAALAAAPQSAAEFLATITALRDGPAVGPEEFSRRAAGGIDRRGGLLADLDEGALPQFPRNASRALVRDPRTGRAGHRVHATGPDFATARLRTAQRALLRYALLALDPRRFVPGPGGPALWAWSPEHGTAHLVPVARVRAPGHALQGHALHEHALEGGAPRGRAPRGLGAGATFEEAVAAALRDRRGHRHDTLIVPLDHDPAATAILPYLLRAVPR